MFDPDAGWFCPAGIHTIPEQGEAYAIKSEPGVHLSRYAPPTSSARTVLRETLGFKIIMEPAGLFISSTGAPPYCPRSEAAMQGDNSIPTASGWIFALACEDAGIGRVAAALRKPEWRTLKKLTRRWGKHIGFKDPDRIAGDYTPGLVDMLIG